jgi:hypothetical protein
MTKIQDCLGNLEEHIHMIEKNLERIEDAIEEREGR